MVKKRETATLGEVTSGAFKDSIAGQTLKQIMLHDPIRAALFRKADASLDNWAEQVVSEEPARPCRLAI